MFSTFRGRLLFWFFVFISSNLIIVVLTVAYLQQREAISTTTTLIEAANEALLKKVIAQQNFLSYDTKNPAFFEQGESIYLNKSNAFSDSTLQLISRVENASDNTSASILSQLQKLKIQLQSIDFQFNVMVQKIKLRGYKNLMLEGKMREDVHWLENAPEIPVESILSLRRHEKDFIIRNEQKYVDQLNALSVSLIDDLDRNKKIAPTRKAEVRSKIEGYQQKFNQLVKLDRSIGIKDNTGLKLQLDNKINTLETDFSQLVEQTKNRNKQLYFRLNLIFLLVVILLLLGSLWLSYLMSQKITKPLIDLTTYITRFVDSNFTLKDANPKARSKDEIGKLTQNFSILKDEITHQLHFFKQKVDERTQELATVNQRLRNINEANSRFVPKEFIDMLGKTSIEEVHLGDNSQQELTILFTDIRSFTKISEQLSPQENFDFINGFLRGIVPVIRKHNGVIDKFIGDTVMALFPDGPENALKAALEFEQALIPFNKEQEQKGNPAVIIGTGIHTGQMILGTIGNQERLETTVISDAVNIASRVEGLTKFYKASTIITEEVILNLPEYHYFQYRFLDLVKVKGKSKTQSIFELISPDDYIKLSYQKNYNQAVILMRNKQIKEAAQIFKSLYQVNPNDETIKVILDRCNQYLDHGLPKNWDGVEHMKEK